jgi:Flp pilus assembly pilin Flp
MGDDLLRDKRTVTQGKLCPRQGQSMLSFLTKLYEDQSGAAALEYGLLIALISGVIIGLVRATGTTVSSMFSIPGF